ncbi:TetR/AcrR family transcriptional regulator [Cryobacterium lactosi]|uniref:TetR/AcrR family transcriptional regulator n=1 Tax=Cryobacterium lactosi TaxID=1259202 RepID=A0A4R9BUE6_9MICO|nr:TetR/AcrR family transcriptional regulator [Cryobacterium lactosi]TFD90804.1 TetR/AcrR family transcriptional regulator [Cryobacterium lactosi]
MSTTMTARQKGFYSRGPYSETALQILQAAICDFDEGGFSGSSIGQIAEHAGISKSLVTYYFPTKALLAAAVLNQAYPGGVFMGVERHAVNPLDAIVDGVDHVASNVVHNGLARVALNLRNEPDLRHQGSPDRFYGWLTRVTDYLDEARRGGLIRRETHVEMEARFIVAGMIGLISLALQTAHFPSLVSDVVAITSQRIDLLRVMVL